MKEVVVVHCTTEECEKKQSHGVAHAFSDGHIWTVEETDDIAIDGIDRRCVRKYDTCVNLALSPTHTPSV